MLRTRDSAWNFARAGSPARVGSQLCSRLLIIERKLQLLDSAGALGDLSSPPNNRLEALKGDRKGQHSIRVNDQYRLCFRWTSEGPEDVDLVDYH